MSEGLNYLQLKIPEGWSQVTIGEMGDLRTSSVDKKFNEGELHVKLINYMDVYRKNVIDSNETLMDVTATESELASSAVRRGDILFTPSSETPNDIGYSSVVKKDFEGTLFSYHLVRLRPNIKLDFNFSRYVFNATYVRNQFERKATGSTRFTLSLSSFYDTRFLLPPLGEQKLIGNLLSSIDHVIEKTEAIILQTEKVKKGLVQQLLTKGVGHKKFKKTEIGEIPEKWNIGQLVDLAKDGIPVLKTGPFGSSLKREHFTNQGIPVINIANLLENGLDTVNLFYVSKEKADALRGYQVHENDILFSRVADIGRSVVVPESANGWIMSSNLMRIRIDSNKVLPDYLYFQIVYGTYVLRQLKNSISDAGRPVVNSKVLNSLKFPIPSLEEQKEIVNTLLYLNQKIQHEKNTMELQLILKKGLMQSLLTGKVRVKVDKAEVTQV